MNNLIEYLEREIMENQYKRKCIVTQGCRQFLLVVDGIHSEFVLRMEAATKFESYEKANEYVESHFGDDIVFQFILI